MRFFRPRLRELAVALVLAIVPLPSMTGDRYAVRSISLTGELPSARRAAR
jgi:hypothetical protein